MPKRSKQKQPFDSRGGVIVISRRMVNHDNYQSLTSQAKVLMLLLQEQWRSDRYVDFGISEAAQKIPCSRKTAMKSFKLLQERGFITCMEEYWFSSRTESRTRAWRLEWMPYDYREPKHFWDRSNHLTNQLV
jgi:hypothetical protein